MKQSNDWRLTNQERYLKRATLRWKHYSSHSKNWEHDHCVFCWTKFMEEDFPRVLHEGYATEGDKHWICKPCFEDFKDMFNWRVVD